MKKDQSFLALFKLNQFIAGSFHIKDLNWFIHVIFTISIMKHFIKFSKVSFLILGNPDVEFYGELIHKEFDIFIRDCTFLMECLEHEYEENLRNKHINSYTIMLMSFARFYPDFDSFKKKHLDFVRVPKGKLKIRIF